jgi:hypothetical protein
VARLKRCGATLSMTKYRTKAPLAMAVMHAQGTFEWRRDRLGIPTASAFDKVVMGKDTKTRQDYLCRLVMERILGRSLDENIRNKWMEHGRKTEAQAVLEFCETENIEVEPCGFFYGKDKRYGASPDRVIKGRSALLEIKCPAPWTHCRYHVYGLGKEYKSQVQGQMLVTGDEMVYFWSYFPGLPPYKLETHRDEKYITKLSEELENFCDELDQKTKAMKKLGRVDLNTALYVLAELMPEDF